MSDTWVQRGAAEYTQAIEAELPIGEAWSRDPAGGLMKWVAGCADTWGDVAARAAVLLLTESDPRATFELLPDWERAFGLPDQCVAEPQTIEERRDALITRITTLGGQSRAFFESVAAALGYTIEIYEYAPYTCGISYCGETRPNGGLTFDYAHCGDMQSGVDPICTIKTSGNDDWYWQLGAPELRYYWIVRVFNTRLAWFRGGTGECGQDHHCEFANAIDLECVIRRWAPAHGIVIFDYSKIDYVLPASLDFSNPFNSVLLLTLL